MGTATIISFDGSNMGTTVPWNKLSTLNPSGTATIHWQIGSVIYVATFK